MKKKNTNKSKLVFKNKNTFIIKEEDTSGIASSVKQDLSALAGDVGNVFKTAVIAAKKMWNVTISYSIDLFAAWYKGESIRAVHVKHAEKQRQLSSEIKNCVNSMSGMNDLNSFISFAAPHMKAVDVIVNNAGKADEFLEKKSTEYRKRYNVVLEEVCTMADVNVPKSLILDTGERKDNDDYNIREFCNGLIDIFKYFDGTLIAQPLTFKRVGRRSMESFASSIFSSAVSAAKKIKEDNKRFSILKKLIQKGLTDDDGKNHQLQKKSQIALEQLFISSSLNVNTFKDLMYTLIRRNELNTLSKVSKDLEEISRHKSDEISQLFLINKDKKSKSSEESESTADEESESTTDEESESTADEESESTTEPVNSGRVYSLKFKNKSLIKEEASVANDDEAIIRLIMNSPEMLNALTNEDLDVKKISEHINTLIVGFPGKSITHVLNAILFNDLLVSKKIINAYAICVNNFITTVNKTIDVYYSFFVNKKIDKQEIDNISFENKEAVEKEINSLNKLIENINFEEIAKIVPQLKDSQKELEEYIAVVNEYFNSFTQTIENIKKESTQNIEKLSVKNDDVISSLLLCESFFKAIIEMNLEEVKKDLREEISSEEIIQQQNTCINLYEEDQDELNTDVYQSIGYIKNFISKEKISRLKEYQKTLDDMINLENDDFTQKVKKYIQEIEEEIKKAKDKESEESKSDSETDESGSASSEESESAADAEAGEESESTSGPRGRRRGRRRGRGRRRQRSRK